ncbi:putative Ig domain-containing protein [Rhodococcus marinonascens]|uniref:putative Ig domain-containing protein n=1 Tax=Rhodococcus marinonascens TaxID=38311 RepID=UPI000A06C17C|nr:putative Ig domain-containing protein [Rhodococcus marinonascens]
MSVSPTTTRVHGDRNPAPTVAVTDGVLPSGVTLSEQGVFSGTSTTGGAHTFTVTASSGIGDDAVLEVTVDITPATWGSFAGS